MIVKMKVWYPDGSYAMRDVWVTGDQAKRLMMSNQNQSPPTHNPYIAGPLPGLPNQGMPTTQGQIGHAPMQNVGGITVVNSTGDPRVIWEDGKFAVIHARDFPANTGMGRGPTRKDVQDAINTQVDPARQNSPGSGSINDFCKVVLAELLARAVTAKAPVSAPTRPGSRPPPVPMIASGYGSVPKGTVIPDAHFPHVCGMCGGWYYQGSGEHPTPDGRCPTSVKKKK